MPLKHKGYAAYISCNGEELQIHKPKAEKDTVTVSGYIVSEAGAVCLMTSLSRQT